MNKIILIRKKWLVLMYSCLQPNKWCGWEIVRYFCIWKCLSLEVLKDLQERKILIFSQKKLPFF
jgi:hypothetical protein